jgi:hypothetical protein
MADQAQMERLAGEAPPEQQVLKARPGPRALKAGPQAVNSSRNNLACEEA